MIYVNGLGNISPIDSKNNSLDFGLPQLTDHTLRSIEPNYKEYINERLLRRMARIIKISVTASGIALKDAGVGLPDAIITATGLGCLEDTEDFLKQLIVEKEQILSPTAFIKSTHNTIGGQIALLQSNPCYNMTYAHRHFSFESALLDGILLLNENDANNVLVGGIDELTPTSTNLLQQLGCVSISEKDQLPIAGEGAAFLVLSNEPNEHSYAKIVKVKTYHYHQNPLADFLQETGFSEADIDFVLSGDGNHLLGHTPILPFKNLSGEYHTATAFACWLGSLILKEQQLPTAVNMEQPFRLQNILIYNRISEHYHSLILLSAC